MTRDAVTHELVDEERYELSSGPAYQFAPDRREFIQVLGAGIVISLVASGAPAEQIRSRFGGGSGQPTKVKDRIHVGADGTVTVLTGKVEVGQGSRTEVCQAAAEELRIPLAQVQAVLGDTELCPNDGGTSGSGTTPRTIPSIRSAAATARQILVELAAKELGADAQTLRVDNGVILDSRTNRSITYAAIAKSDRLPAALDIPSLSDAKIERVESWRVLGTSPPKVNGRQIVTGAHRYPSDIQLPNMLYGKILRAPAYGARLVSIDPAAAGAFDSVHVVRDGEFVGCAAPSSWLAAKALDAIAAAAKWELPDPSSYTTSEALDGYLKEHASTGSGESGESGRRSGGSERGSVSQRLAEAEKTLEASYKIAYIQHAPMEPRAAVAEWKDDHLTVWTGTQNPLRVKGELLQVFRLPADRVRVIVPDTGGAFGGKHTGEVAIEAARLAKASGRPVSVRWTREEEFTWAYFRPAGLIEIRGGLDSGGKLSAWDFVNYNSGGSAIVSPYEIPSARTRSVACEAPLRSGSYRALASTANNFARECFMDELAAAAGIDPLAFRLQHLKEGRLRDVLLAAAERFDWSSRSQRREANRGVGLACGTEKASFVAACAEVTVDRASGRVKIEQVCQAFECGAIQNPLNLRAQVEGCLIMGLGGALSERIEFAEGKLLNGRFSQYHVPRTSDVPPIDTVLLNRRDLPSAGAGETPIIAVAPAVANAIFSATAVRLRSMPLDTALLKVS